MKKNNFDLLRLSLAGIVFLYHSARLSQNPDIKDLLYLSSEFAVQAFFAVSGYLVLMSYENSRSLGNYASKRIRRIFPGYIAVILFAIVLGGFLTTLSLGHYLASTEMWRYLGFNLAFMNFSAPTLPGVFTHNPVESVNTSLWTLKIELVFYLFVPFLAWLCRKYSPYWVLGALYVGSVVFRSGLTYLANQENSEFFLKLAKQFPGQLAFFVVGSLMFYMGKAGHRLSVLWFILGVTLYAATDDYLNMAVGPAAVGMIAIYLAVDAPYFGNFGKFGDFSYGLYIYHCPLVQSAISIGLFAYSPILAIAILSLILTCVSVASWHAIERPFLNR